MDTSQQLAPAYRILVLGQTAVIDREGRIVYNGPRLGYEGLKALVEKVI